MNMNHFLALPILVFSLNTFAEQAPFVTYEADKLKIMLSNDGTGVVQDVECRGCDFKVVKITSDSRATIDGKEVSIFEARKRAGKEAMVSFNPETREVQFIRWSE